MTKTGIDLTCPDCNGTGTRKYAIEPDPTTPDAREGAVTCELCGGRGTIKPGSKQADAPPPSLVLDAPREQLEVHKGEIAASVQAKLDDEADDVAGAAAKLSGEAADYAALSADRAESAAGHAEAAAVAAAASAGVAEQAAATIAALSGAPPVAPDTPPDTLPKTTWTCPHCAAENPPEAAPTCGRCGKDWSAEPDAPGANGPDIGELPGGPGAAPTPTDE